MAGFLSTYFKIYIVSKLINLLGFFIIIIFKGGERRNEAIGKGTEERKTEGIVIEVNNEINGWNKKTLRPGRSYLVE